MDLDLVCVESLLVLLDEGHYGRAAARLNVTSSALTKRVQRLERQVGIPLLVRSTAAVAGPTPAGARFAHEAAPLLAQARAAYRAAHAPRRTVLRLGVPGAVGEYPRRRELVDLGARLRQVHPDVSLQCRGLPFSGLVEDLVSERVDVVWTAGVVDHPDVAVVPFAVVPRTGVVGPRSSFADAGSAPVADFAAEVMLHDPLAPPGFMEVWYLGDLRPRREARLVEVAAGDAATVLRTLARGEAVTVLLEAFTRFLPPPLHAVRLDGAPPVVFVACHRRADRRPVVRDLVQVMADVARAPVDAS